MSKSIAGAIAALGLMFAASPAAMAQGLAGAIETRDVRALSVLGSDAARPIEAQLARGVLAALRGEDDDAILNLSAAANASNLAPELRSTAWGNLAGVLLRLSRFSEAASAMEAGQALSVEQDAAKAASSAQSLAFARALAAVAPMTFEVASAGEAEIERDMARLPRTEVTINGRIQDAVLDTGAGFSTISESTARRMELRFLEATITVGTATSTATPARLAVAETLRIGGGEFQNVVFIVLPDRALTFLGGIYHVRAIVGFPVLRQLGRLEFATHGRNEIMRHGRSPYGRSADSNLLLDGARPIAMVSFAGGDLQMLIDTGANRSHLSHRAAEEFPALVADAVQGAGSVRGAGGAATDEAGMTIGSLSLDVAGRSIMIEDVPVRSLGAIEDHGVIGQDLLRSGSGYVIDFDAMRFEALEAEAPDGRGALLAPGLMMWAAGGLGLFTIMAAPIAYRRLAVLMRRDQPGA
jgi:predicted aspartyl protease